MSFWFGYIAVLLLNIQQFHRTTTSETKTARQELRCFSRTDYSGDELLAISRISDLAEYNMDNRISSCCVYGNWILYSQTNYNQRDENGDVWLLYGDYCAQAHQLFDNIASSLRLAGAPDNRFLDTLNIFRGRLFAGEDRYITKDLENISVDLQSLVVTGCFEWTLFSNSYYSGYSVCVQNGNSADCTPGFYKNLGQFGWTRIGSVKRGCSSTLTILPDNSVIS